MIRVLIAVFLVLHGLVHLLYFGQSSRYFELQPGMVWPDGSWIFSRFFSEEGVRYLASISLVLAAVGFAATGAGIFLKQDWWKPVAIGAAVFSSVVYLLFWDGMIQSLDNKGGIGVLINLAILSILASARWSNFEL